MLAGTYNAATPPAIIVQAPTSSINMGPTRSASALVIPIDTIIAVAIAVWSKAATRPLFSSSQQACHPTHARRAARPHSSPWRSVDLRELIARRDHRDRGSDGRLEEPRNGILGYCEDIDYPDTVLYQNFKGRNRNAPPFDTMMTMLTCLLLPVISPKDNRQQETYNADHYRPHHCCHEPIDVESQPERIGYGARQKEHESVHDEGK